ncbi:MAG: transcriptional repressor LexA [SAR202 cluster bacterium]|nr:transcriptional repressor LexA [SAR202 cluster bacterium]
MGTKISGKQQSILSFIRDFLEQHQFPPTIRDIQYGCKISSTSVVDYNLRILQREGYLRRFADVSRGIELLGENQVTGARRDVVSVPVFGVIAAGQPLSIPPSDTWHTEEIDHVDLPSFLTEGKDGVFAVRVKGESMIDALIGDGDLVIMEPTNNPQTGDMVAAWLSDTEEVTLKHFYMTSGMVRLQPANATMDPIIVPADKVSVQGRVVGVVRSM